MLKIYGSKLCKDCIACLEAFDKADIAYEYLDFADALINLKEFLAMETPCLTRFGKPEESGFPVSFGLMAV